MYTIKMNTQNERVIVFKIARIPNVYTIHETEIILTFAILIVEIVEI